MVGACVGDAGSNQERIMGSVVIRIIKDKILSDEQVSKAMWAEGSTE